jgi:hypothetical protein
MDAQHCGTLVDDRSKVPTKARSAAFTKLMDMLPKMKYVEGEPPYIKVTQLGGPDSGFEQHGIGKVMAEIEAAVENAPTPPPGYRMLNQLGPTITQLGGPDSGFEQHGTPAHLPTPCCKYRAELSNAYPIFWNPFNKVVQCHNCGHQYAPVK